MEQGTIRKLLISGGLAIEAALGSGCASGVAVNERYVWYRDQASANNPQYNIHELEHQKQMAELKGGAAEFWGTYFIDRNQACKWEKEANTAAGIYPTEDHLACKVLFTAQR